MAIDNEEKRRTTLRVLPKPDGTTSEPDRRRSVFIYGFEEAGPSAVAATYQVTIETIWALPIIQALFTTETSLGVDNSYGTPVESSSELDGPYTSPIDSSLSVAGSYDYAQDSLLGMAGSYGYAGESLLQLSVQNLIAADSLLSLAVNGNVSTETLLGLESTPYQTSLESVSNIPLSSIITLSTLLNIGLGHISTIDGLAAFIGSVGLSQESISALYTTLLSNIESSSSLVNPYSIVGSSMSNLTDPKGFAISSLLAMYANHTTTIDTLLSVLLTTLFAENTDISTALVLNQVVETLSGLSIANVVVIESLSETPVILLSKDEALCVESIGNIYAQQNTVIESILSMIKSSDMSISSILSAFGYYTSNIDSGSNLGLQFNVPASTLAKLSSVSSYPITSLSEIDIAAIVTIEASAQVSNSSVFATSSLRGLNLTTLVNVENVAQVLLYSANSLDTSASIQAAKDIPIGTSANMSGSYQSAVESVITVLFQPSQLLSIDTLIGVLLNAGIAIDTDSFAAFQYPGELSAAVAEGRVYTLKVDNITIVAIPSVEQYGSIPEGVRIVSLGSNDIFKSTGN